MSKSLAELRQSPRVGLPERTYQLCVASKVLGEFQSLLSDLEDAQLADAAKAEGDESAAPPKRMGDSPATAKIRARMTELNAELVEHTGTLTLRGLNEGAWRLWVDEHPAREGNERDDHIAYGYCNADDLIDSLASFAHAWNGDELGSGDWAFLADNAAPGDLKAIAQLVVKMHETVVNLPKLLSSSPEILAGESE